MRNVQRSRNRRGALPSWTGVSPPASFALPCPPCPRFLFSHDISGNCSGPCLKNGGMRDWCRFFCQARRLDAGILTDFKSRQRSPGGKRCLKTAFCHFSNMAWGRPVSLPGERVVPEKRPALGGRPRRAFSRRKGRPLPLPCGARSPDRAVSRPVKIPGRSCR